MRRSKTRKYGAQARDGFTLVELLVVIAIIGILVSMLLPVATSALESAREANCKSNMDQVVTAMVSHETAKKAYPVGADSKTGHSGLTHLLPFLGSELAYGVFDKAGFENPITEGAFTQVTDVEVPIYVCPSDSAADGGVFSGSGDQLFSRSNIVMCFGGGTEWQSSSGGSTNEGGIWRVNARSSSSLASDGSVTTAALSEVAADPVDGLYGIWSVSATGANGYTHSQVPRKGVVPSTETSLPAYADGLTFSGGRASSHHRDLVNVAFVDSHVESVESSVNPNVWSAMGTAAGGELIKGDSVFNTGGSGATGGSGSTGGT